MKPSGQKAKQLFFLFPSQCLSGGFDLSKAHYIGSLCRYRMVCNFGSINQL